MANLIEVEQWEEGIYQLETDDPVLGGEDGIDNLQAKQLGNRTKWLKAQLLLRALIDSPEFTGTPKVPTAAPGTNNTQAASTAFTKAAIDAAIAALVDSSPGALDTLNELAAALGDDPNFATTITNALALKAPWSTIDEVITEAGMIPDHGVLTQLRDAIQAMIASAQINVPAGHVDFFAMNTAPAGYLKANGAQVSRTTYADLFAAIGTTFGAGDGSTTFTLPDLRGEFLRGWDDGRGLDSGRAFGSVQLGTLNAVDSNADGAYTLGVVGNPTLAQIQTSVQLDAYTTADYNTSVRLTPASISGGALALPGTGGNQGGSGVTRPHNIALLACIKY